jgi:hypothetical protein
MVEATRARRSYRRAAAAVSAAALAATPFVASATPAAAAIRVDAQSCYVNSWHDVVGGWLNAGRERVCPDETLALFSNLQQWKNGQWRTVASGVGTVQYRCKGTASTRYRFFEQPSAPFNEPCG